MTPTELVKNFVKQYRKPFAAETIAGYTTIETAEINRFFRISLRLA